MGLGTRLANTVVFRVSAHRCSTITPYFSLPWALAMCQIMHKTSGWSQRTIAIVMAISIAAKLVHLYHILDMAVAPLLNMEASDTNL